MAVDAGGIASSVRDELAPGLRGAVVCPGDRGYDTLRAVFNGMIDRRPLAVIRSVDASDVLRCIAFARRHDLPLSVRGGGHSVAGNAVGDGAVMLDLSGMKALRVDPETRTVRAEPGLTLGEFDRATQAFGVGDDARGRVVDRDRGGSHSAAGWAGSMTTRGSGGADRHRVRAPQPDDQRASAAE